MDLEKCEVEAHIDLGHRGVMDLRVLCYGSDCTEHVPEDIIKELEAEALYEAGLFQ